VRCLSRCDVVVYDYLANPRLLDHAPAEAERILVGKHGGGARVEQSTIVEMLISRARRGDTIVRLKGGDPFVFGRGAEEAEALAAAGIPFEVVPGVTSAVAVPAYAGIPLTERDSASSFTVLTGYEYPDKKDLAVRWDAVARRGSTLVLLMTTRQLRSNMAALIANGMAADTPVALIRWGSVAEQETLIGTASTIAELAEARRLQPPAVAVVGDVVLRRERLKWFERKPLFGKRIVVTRPRDQAKDFVEALEDAGADVLTCPTIEIVPPKSWQAANRAMRELASFDWIVFTSVNGVRMFFDHLRALGQDVRELHRAKLAGVGPATAEALGARGLLVDIVPEQEYRAEGLAAALRAAGVAGKRVLLPRAAAAREILVELLADVGAAVEEVPVYQTVLARSDPAEVRRRLSAGEVDLVTFTSSSTVRNFIRLLGSDAVELLARTQIGCIGPITADTARELGLKVHLCPERYTIEALTEAIMRNFCNAKSEAPSHLPAL
jgi:uroporphyrinogen III methyltransferase/synthase